MTQQLCPEPTVLAAFAHGELQEEIFERIAAHVPECPSCQQALAQLGDGSDALLAGLRHVGKRQDNAPQPDTRPTQHDNPAAVSTAQAPPGYELLDEVGRGGMGVVYRARDTRLNREVAIKLLRDDTPAQSAFCDRFIAEAQITGQLQHPSIPAVHELGQLPNDLPFLAMKLVKGRTLQQLLHERSDPSQERGRFLAIFEQICQAVGYVHAHRVIHRDLKPSNVMVGAFGEVQVMDWGLAKLLSAVAPTEADDSVLPETLLAVTAIETPQQAGSATRTGAVMGTPAYMAPEQAGGDVRTLDARSDVFGLGAILCEILTGRPPYQGKDALAVRLQAVRGDLVETLARLDACGAEPEVAALCKRCLAFKQKDRPADAGTVAAEVANIRQAAEERARRAELEQAEAQVKAREERKRRRWAWAAVFLLLAGIAGSTWQALRAKKAEEQARQNESRALQAAEAEVSAKRLAEQAAESERKAKDLAQNRLGHIEKVNDVLTSIFIDLNPQSERKGDPNLRVQLSHHLERAAAQLDKAANGDPVGVARLQTTLARALRHLGRSEAAVGMLREAVKTLEDHLEKNHPDTLMAYHNLASAYGETGRNEESIRLHEQNLKARRSKLGVDHQDTLNTCNDLAVAYFQADRIPDVIRLLEPSLKQMEAKLGTDHHLTLICRTNLAWAYHQTDRTAKAIPLYEKSLKQMEDKLGADQSDALNCRASLAAMYLNADRSTEAIRLYEQNLKLASARLGRDHLRTLTFMGQLANAYYGTGKVGKALPVYEEVLQLQRVKQGVDHPLTLTTLGNLALAYCDAKQGAKAVPLFAEYFERQRKRTKPNDLGFAGQLAHTSQTLLTCQRYKEAESYIRECLAIRTKMQPDAWNTFNAQSILGGALLGQKKYAEAEPLLLKGYEGMKQREAKIPKEGKVRLPEAGMRLVKLYDAWGKPEQAAKWRKDLSQRKTTKIKAPK